MSSHTEPVSAPGPSPADAGAAPAAAAAAARPLVLFDGVCNLCDASVRFITARDPARLFTFAPLQSPAGRRLAGRFGLAGPDANSVVLVEAGRCYTRSTAALRIARRLSGAWPALYALVLLPRPVRDAAYDRVARNRYRWFGRRDACRMPSPADAGRFVDGDVPGRADGSRAGSAG